MLYFPVHRFLTIMIACSILAAIGQGQTIVFVDADAAPGGNGSSWATAFQEVYEALDAASDPGTQYQLWIAEGVYRPGPLGTDPFDYEATFMLADNVDLYGGFVGTETSISMRDPDPTAYPSVLSGYFPDENDRVWHVVTGDSSLSTGVTLDRLTIADGNTVYPSVDGAGVLLNESIVTFIDCTFRNNNAGGQGGSGGGVYAEDSVLTFTDCAFRNNFADSLGGGLYSSLENESDLTLTRCTFDSNLTDGWVGAVHAISGGALIVEGCSFIRNGAIYGGGIYATNLTSVDISGSLFEENTGTGGGGALSFGSSTVSISHCTFQYNTTGNQIPRLGMGGAITLGYTTTEITESLFLENTAFYGGAIFTESDNITITSSDFVENVATGDPTRNQPGYGGAIRSSSTLTLFDCLFFKNQAQVNDAQGGAIYGTRYGSQPRNILASACRFEDNHSDGDGGAIASITQLDLVNSSFVGNTLSDTPSFSHSGGAVVIGYHPLTASNCGFFMNSAADIGYGGAIYLRDTGSSPAVLKNCTMTENYAGMYGGAIYANKRTVTLENSIVWENTAQAEADIYKQQIDGTSNFMFNIQFSNVQEIPVPNNNNNINDDPQFQDAATGNYRLQSISPCRDTGSNNLIPADTGDLDGDGDTAEDNPYDLDLFLRIDDSSFVDMGCYEYRNLGCIADFNNDGMIDTRDFLLFLKVWADEGVVADINGDGQVDILDYILFTGLWADANMNGC